MGSLFLHILSCGGDSMTKERGPGWPDSKDDVINKYGTYEVQATNGTENDYPQIAQGMAKQQKELLKKKAEQWRKQ